MFFLPRQRLGGIWWGRANNPSEEFVHFGENLYILMGNVGVGRGKHTFLYLPRRPSEENFQVTPCRGLAPPQASRPRRALEDKRTQENLKTIRFDQVSNFRWKNKRPICNWQERKKNLTDADIFFCCSQFEALKGSNNWLKVQLALNECFQTYGRKLRR